MHGNWLGVLYSVILISVGYVFHDLIRKKDSFIARKFLHIWVSNWYFIYVRCFDSPWLAIWGLAAYALFNLALEVFYLKSGRYGTIYYPLSIIVLLCLQYYKNADLSAVACGILAMGYGDGFAAVIGRKIKSARMPFVMDKSVLGSLTMFVITFAVVLIFAECSIATALLIGFIAVLFEAYIPFGLDNISVPIVVYFLVNRLC